jgi:hypothetical protein
MALEEKTFISDFIEFSKQSMGWCIAESEKEAGRIYGIVKDIVDDLKRRSQMSEKSIESIKKLEKAIAQTIDEKQSKIQMNDILTQLHVLKGDDEEVYRLINPIVESLQFQDRLRQNLENISKLSKLWMTHRSENGSIGIKDEELIEFGALALKCTTSQDERTIIRKHIKGLPEEQKVAAVSFMF